MNIQDIQTYINIVPALLAVIPTIWAIYKHIKAGEALKALDETQIAIGNGGTIYEVVERISSLNNKVIEERLTKNGAIVIASQTK